MTEPGDNDRKAEDRLRKLGVPDTAAYVNECSLTDDILKREAHLTAPTWPHYFYLAAGMVFCLAAVGFHSIGGGKISTIAIMVLGLFLIIQQLFFTHEASARLCRQFRQRDEGDRWRLTWFCDGKAFVRLLDGETRAYPYDHFTRIESDEAIVALPLGGNGGALVVTWDGFVRGDAEGFEDFLAGRIGHTTRGTATPDASVSAGD